MGALEIITIFIIYLLFFGAKGIPGLARNMGKAVRYFKDATSDIQKEIMDGGNEIKKDIDSNFKDPFKDVTKND